MSESSLQESIQPSVKRINDNNDVEEKQVQLNCQINETGNALIEQTPKEENDEENEEEKGKEGKGIEELKEQMLMESPNDEAGDAIKDNSYIASDSSNDLEVSNDSPLTSPELVEQAQMNENKTRNYKPRVYIKNIPYDTTEEELENIFQDYNVFFKTSKFRPLGIAYIEFKTHEDVDRAIKEKNESLIRNRILIVKRYETPYFYSRFIRPTFPTENKPKLKLKESENTIFINKIPHKVTSEDIKEFFVGYEAGPVYLFQNRGSEGRSRSLSFSAKTRSAFVTFDNVSNITDIIQEFKTKKLNGRILNMKPAFQNKIDEVILAAKKTQGPVGTNTPDKNIDEAVVCPPGSDN